MKPMEPHELARWTRFAAKGGIGKCTAVQDCIAERKEDLMFLKDDDIIVLKQELENDGVYLGYCEGVVGYFHGKDVRFHSRLKKFIMTKRSSSISAKSPTPDAAFHIAPTPAAATTTTPPPAVPQPQPQSQPMASTSSSSLSSSTSNVYAGTSSDALRRSESTNSETFLVDRPANATSPSPDSRTPTTPDSITTAQGSRSSRYAITHRPDLTSTAPSHRHTESSSQDHTTSSSLNGLHERTYDYSASNHRLSTASDGELGIGLSLLQDLVNSADLDNWSDTDTEQGGSSNDHCAGLPLPGTKSDPSSHTKPNLLESRRRSSSAIATAAAAAGPTSPASTRQSQSDWEGASDIYDDYYRYSRQSLASKMSSRYSQSSIQTINSAAASKAPPPLPSDAAERKQSTDSDSNSSLVLYPSQRAAPNGVAMGRRPSGEVGDSNSLIGATFSSSGSGTSPPTSPDTTSRESFCVSPTSSLSTFPPVVQSTTAVGAENERVWNVVVVVEGGGKDRVAIVKDDPGVSAIARDEIESASASSSSHSSSPDIQVAPLLGPLRVANRTPSPSPSVTVSNVSRSLTPSPTPLLITNGATGSVDTLPATSAPPTPVTPTFPQMQPSQGGVGQQSLVPSVQGQLGWNGRGRLSPSPPAVQVSAPSQSQPQSQSQSQPQLQPQSQPQPQLQPQSQPQPQPQVQSPSQPQPHSHAQSHAQSQSQFQSQPQSQPQPQPPQPTPQPTPRHITPTQPGAPPPPTSRRSLFLPHPNAPKPAPTPSEPMYHRRALLQDQQQHPIHAPPRITENSAIHVIRMAVSGPRGPGPCTIYGRCEVELARAVGPVPITFSLEPLPPLVVRPPPQSNPQAQSQVVGRLPISGMPRRPATTTTTLGMAQSSVGFPLSPNMSSNAPLTSERPSVQVHQAASAGPPSTTQSIIINNNGPPQPQSQPQHQSQPHPPTESAAKTSTSARSSVAGSSKPVESAPSVSPSASTNSNVLPRANFTPKVKTPRPRSRSFSGFQTPSALTLNTNLGGKPNEVPSKPHRSKTASAFSPPSPKHKSGNRGIHPPSPLSLPQNNSVADVSTKTTTQNQNQNQMLNSPSNGSMQFRLSPMSPSFPNDRGPLGPPGPSSSSQPAVRHVQSSAGLGLGLGLGEGARFRPTSIRGEKDGDGSSAAAARRSEEGYSQRHLSTTTTSSLPPVLPTTVGAGAGATGATGATGVGRTPSLKSKLSLPNLRGKNVGRMRQDDAWNVNLGMGIGGPGARDAGGDATVQVEDMDFELVRPIIPLTTTRSEDSTLTVPGGGRGSSSFDLKGDVGAIRFGADSPMSVGSSVGGSSQMSPIVPESGGGSWNSSKAGENSMDAHRQRELKWVSVMSSVPSAQARKSKKVRKLLLEGVPSSVRFLVWAHLTDSKARGVPGVYAQLGQRVKASAYLDVRRDVQRCLADQQHLQVPQEALLALLHTYLTMVPDVRYERGLAILASHILLLSPEEDAFWIFSSMMDAHLRPYFSPNAVQVEVDALLFSKALEVQDPPLTKKIFFDLGVTAAVICRPWFGCVFAESLPTEYLRRVWDLFLYEGLPFLFRVGLALISCCRRQLILATNAELLLRHLRYPPPSCLPPDPEAFLALVFSVKVKDEDVRKQRVKMEAQLKRQTQVRTAAS